MTTTTYRTNIYPIPTEDADEIDFTAIVHEWVKEQHARSREAATKNRDQRN